MAEVPHSLVVFSIYLDNYRRSKTRFKTLEFHVIIRSFKTTKDTLNRFGFREQLGNLTEKLESDTFNGIVVYFIHRNRLSQAATARAQAHHVQFYYRL